MTMTYYGTTAGSTQRNPPVLMQSVIGGRIQYPGDLSSSPTGAQWWHYASTNAVADVSGAAGVFTDGGILGMQNGDLLFGILVSSGGTTSFLHYYGTLCSTNNSNGTGAFSLTTNYTT